MYQRKGSIIRQPPAAVRLAAVAVVTTVGLGVPFLHWLYTGWGSDQARWAARLIALSLLCVWFLGRPIAVVVADRSKRRASLATPASQGVSVIVPCHNAALKVGALVESVLAQEYRPLEIILVENNSNDGTFDVLLALERQHREVRARWIPPKAGEYAASVALNAGVEQARYPVIMRLDDDTSLAPGAIAAAMSAITDGEITAVACNLRVSNPDDSVWTRLQALEYLLAMELDRRSQALLHTLLICSGGMQVFRRDVIVESGGYVAMPRVVSEDFDMTLKAHREGYVTVAPDSIGYTEVPRTLRQLVKQRYRWAICGSVSLWLHRRGICSPRYWYGGLIGFIGMPMRGIMFARDSLPVAFALDAAFMMHGDWTWFAVLALARMMLLAVQLVALSPSLRCRQGLGNAILIPAFAFAYGPILLVTRFVGTLTGIKHIAEQREKLRLLELSPRPRLAVPHVAVGHRVDLVI